MIKDIDKIKDIHNINMKIFVLIKKFKNKWKIWLKNLWNNFHIKKILIKRLITKLKDLIIN